MELETVATHDPYFVDRGLYPNVDFYSGIVLRALGVSPPQSNLFCHICIMKVCLSTTSNNDGTGFLSSVSTACKYNEKTICREPNLMISVVCLQIPVSMYTVLFAVARTVGWVAQWAEMAKQQQEVPKISRPRQVLIPPSVPSMPHMRRPCLCKGCCIFSSGFCRIWTFGATNARGKSICDLMSDIYIELMNC